MCMGGLEALRNVLESLGAVGGWVISLFLVWDKVSNKRRKKPTINFYARTISSRDVPPDDREDLVNSGCVVVEMRIEQITAPWRIKRISVSQAYLAEELLETRGRSKGKWLEEPYPPNRRTSVKIDRLFDSEDEGKTFAFLLKPKKGKGFKGTITVKWTGEVFTSGVSYIEYPLKETLPHKSLFT